VLVVSHEAGRTGHGYYRVDLESGRADLLHRTTGQQRGPSNPRLSADGKRLVYIDSDGDVRLARLMQFDIAARRETELKHAAAGQSFTSVAVSPDGEQLAYLVSDDRAASTALDVMPLTGGSAREVFRAAPWSGNVRFGVLAWTPDQRHLLFVRPGDEGAQELWSISAAGGEPEKVGVSYEGAIKSPEIQPDGSRIAFSATKSAAPEVWALENFLPAAAKK
jgi:Tol biopolymer transport system component